MQTIDSLDPKTAQAIEALQQLSRKESYEFQFSTTVKNEIELSISPYTQFFKAEALWVDAEFYFYGTLKDAGGKGKANIHIDTEDYGYLTIETEKNFLMEQQENLLYKTFGVRATGKQHVQTGEMDPQSLKLVELFPYHSEFDAEYLSALIAKAKKSWEGVDADEWLASLRAGDSV